MVLREALAPLVDAAQDDNLTEAERRALMTSANIRTQMIIAESQCASQPARLGRYGRR
jgi:hypothetical protein